MTKKFIKGFNFLMSVVLIAQLVGCGTIMYPERKGQKSGKIDSGVAVLDGIGLLLFIIPGIIAFAVDFNNGTIYLPGTSKASLDIQDIKQVKFDPKHNNIAGIERMIQEQTGYTVKLDQSNMRIVKLRSTDEMVLQFAQILPSLQNDQIALNR